MITIIDYGAGNILSIKNMINRLGYNSIISSNANDIGNAKKLILPGVGHFDYGMNSLKSSGFLDILHKSVLELKTPILGICLGAQLMCRTSDESNSPGLGWFDAKVKKFNKNRLLENQKIPHMGWNHANQLKPSNLFNEFSNEMRFYFVHAYHFVAAESDIGLAETNYGYNFLSAMEKDNIFAVQFHPEKSHKYGLKLMDNFINL